MVMNFQDAAKMKTSEIERPPLVPMGTYRAVVKKVPATETIADGRFDTCDFVLGLVEAVEVDEAELKAYGGLTANTVMRHRFMFNKEDQALFDRSLYNLKRFLLDHLKVDAAEDDPLVQTLNASVNTQCLVFVGHRADKNDAEIMYSEIKKTAPLE